MKGRCSGRPFFKVMGKLERWSSKLQQATEANITAGLLRIVRDTQTLAIDLNTSQLLQGKDSKDEALKPYRSEQYALFKRVLNPLGVTDLRLKGGFYRGIFLHADKFPVSFDSADYKTPILTEKYGNDIFGLDKKDKAIYAQDIGPEVRKLMRSLVLPV